MKRIALTGKHAVGNYKYAFVDDEDFAYLNRWRWKAKPNADGNNIYAVRNTVRDRHHVTIRMHREVAGLANGDPREPDHFDHNGLNNVRSNLVVGDHSANMLNARRKLVTGDCGHCGLAFVLEVSALGPERIYCSTTCAAASHASKAAARYATRTSVAFVRCAECGARYRGRTIKRMYCSRSCECKAGYRRRSKRDPRGPTREARVLSTLAASQALTAKEIASRVAVDHKEVQRILRELRSRGAVHQAGRRHDEMTRAQLYSL